MFQNLILVIIRVTVFRLLTWKSGKTRNEIIFERTAGK